MKKNKLFIAGLVTVFVALCSLTLVSSTWAKYTSTASGSDTARVAKWAWEFDDASNASTIKINLFNQNVCELDADGNPTTTQDAEVAQGTKLVAPGTGGSYTFSIKNASEVTGKVKFDFTTTANGVPLQFRYKVDGNNYTAWASELADIDFAEVAMNGTKTLEIQWRWEFERGTGSELDNNDLTDTGFGKTPVDVTVELKVTFEQVN